MTIRSEISFSDLKSLPWQGDHLAQPKVLKPGAHAFSVTGGTHSVVDLFFWFLQGVSHGAVAAAEAGGLYSFFNGLAADNAFFHAVCCRVVTAEVARCHIQLTLLKKIN